VEVAVQETAQAVELLESVVMAVAETVELILLDSLEL
jgi:hypothetical protein